MQKSQCPVLIISGIGPKINKKKFKVSESDGTEEKEKIPEVPAWWEELAVHKNAHC